MDRLCLQENPGHGERACILPTERLANQPYVTNPVNPNSKPIYYLARLLINLQNIPHATRSPLPAQYPRMATPSQVAANQANSQNSSGPKSPTGKARSSRNSFKHGLYAKDLVLPGENPAELDQLRLSLRAEHQPANTTEEVLVNELAEHFWRLRRMREFETRAMQPENIIAWHDSGLLALVQRTMASAERGFHRALADLRRLQKDRGFVPQNSTAPANEGIGFVPSDLAASEKERDEPAILSEAKTQADASVPSKPHETSPGITFVPVDSDAFYQQTGFRTVEELRAHCLSQFDKHSKAA